MDLEEATRGSTGGASLSQLAYAPVKPGAGPVKDRSGKADPTAGMSPEQKADYEKKHPRVAKGRVGGGQFAVSQGTGMKGEADEQVKDVQRHVNEAEGVGKVAVDGRFGPVTATAVRKFQKANGLKPTGDVDDQTYAALNPNHPALASQGEQFAEPPKSRAQVIDEEQKLLGTGKYKKEKGGRSGRSRAKGEGAERSGSTRSTATKKNSAADLDPSDPKSIEDFQRAHGLEVDGIIGPDTQRMIRRSREAADSEAAKERSSSGGKAKKRDRSGRAAKGGSSDGMLRKGESSKSVKLMQDTLSELGYDLGEGGADGEFGDDTEAAVRMVQERYGLNPDGVIGPLTRALIDRLGGRLKAEQKMVGTGKAPKGGFTLVETYDEAEEARIMEQELQEAPSFDGQLHPRDRNGKFAAIVGGLKPGKTAKTKGGVTVHNSPGKPGYAVKSGAKVEVHATPEKAAAAAMKMDKSEKPKADAPSAPEFKKDPPKPDVTSRFKKDSTPSAKLKVEPKPAAELNVIPKSDAKPDKDGVHDVGGDVVQAAKLLAEGKKVRLDQPRQASTLLDELAKRVNAAKALGDEAPDFDLCNVTVKNTSLFCVQSKGIPRVKMPQLSGIPTPGSKADKLEKNDKGEVVLTDLFRKMLSDKGIKISDETEKASFLKASQNQLNGAKVAGMTSVLNGGKALGGDPRLFVSDDNYIVDGHHRWAAHVGNDLQDGKLGDVEMPIARVDLDIIELLAEANNFALDMGIPQAGVGQMLPEGGVQKPKVPKGTKVQEAILAAYDDYLEGKRMLEEAGKPWEKKDDGDGDEGGGMKRCPSCKMKNAKGKAKCFKCGASLAKDGDAKMSKKGEKVQEARAAHERARTALVEAVSGMDHAVARVQERAAQERLEEAEREYQSSLVAQLDSLDPGSRLTWGDWQVTRMSDGDGFWVEQSDDNGLNWKQDRAASAAAAVAMLPTRDMADLNAESTSDGNMMQESGAPVALLAQLEETVRERQAATGTALVRLRAREDALADLVVQEAMNHTAGQFDALHPRDRLGKWMEKLDSKARAPLVRADGRHLATMGGMLPSSSADEFAHKHGGSGVMGDDGNPGTPRGHMGKIVNVEVGAGGLPRRGGTGPTRNAGKQVERARIVSDDGGRFLGVESPMGRHQVERSKVYLVNGQKLPAQKDNGNPGTPRGAAAMAVTGALAMAGAMDGNASASTERAKRGGAQVTMVIPMAGNNPKEPTGGPAFDPKDWDTRVPRHISKVSSGSYFASNSSVYRREGDKAVGVFGQGAGETLPLGALRSSVVPLARKKTPKK